MRVWTAMLLAAALGLAAATPAAASADFCSGHPGALFCEDFENYQFSGGSSSNAGIPLLSEGANEMWYGGRFEYFDNGNVEQDVRIRNLPTIFPNHKKYARVEDDAGILFNIDTSNYTNVQLMFDWRTHLVEKNDRFVVGYFDASVHGALDFVNDTDEGSPNKDLVHSFYLDGPSWTTGGWVELLREKDPNVWRTENFVLPSSTDLWVAFWMDNGEGDFGKVDNIKVTGVLPEPGLALLGLMGAVALRRLRV